MTVVTKNATNQIFVKLYYFIINLISILALLSVEIETVVTTQYPLEITREALVALLSNCDVSNAALGNLGRQYGDAMKFLG